MCRQQFRNLSLAFAILLISGCVTPGTGGSVTINDDTESFDTVDREIDQLVDDYGVNDVLVVLDIDNTVLTSAVDIGGDIWYQWQRNRLDIKPSEEQKVDCLFQDAIGLLYELGPTRLTDTTLPERIRSWQDRGITVFALTSRSPKYRAATERELTRQRIDFSLTPLTSANDSTPVIREMAGQEWSYMKGIMMTTGMNKGTMLTSLLRRFGKDFSAIVFVDDTRRHIDDVATAYRVSNEVDVRLFHFTRIEAERTSQHGAVLTREQAEKMDADWKALNATLNSIFPSRVVPGGCLGD